MRPQVSLLVLLALVVDVGQSMHCLVMRPGYGLVSEQCPANTVACRIRVDKNAIEFYEYSPLYDRNQFVCVLRNEYGDMKQSGCVEKRTGKVRCWCYGRSNCNSVEDSKRLYEAFKSGDKERFREIVEEIDFPNLRNDEPSGGDMTTTTQPLRLPPEKTGPKYATDLNDQTSNHNVLKISSLPADTQRISGMSKSQVHHHPHHKGHKKHHHRSTTTTTKAPKTTTTMESVFRDRVYKSPIVKTSQEHSSIPIPTSSSHHSVSKPIVLPPPKRVNDFTAMTTQPPSTTKEPNVKVIYVNSKDRYQNVIGSDEFRKALHLDHQAEPEEAHLLPIDKDETKKLLHKHKNIDPFNTEYNENDEDNLEDEDPLADLPMTEQEADLYLTDARIPRVKTRSKDLDEYSSSSYYDSAVALSASLAESLSLIALAVWIAM